MEVTTNKKLIIEPKKEKKFIFTGTLEQWREFYEKNKDEVLRKLIK